MYNLNAVYKTDESLEKEGFWYEVMEGVSFKLKRFGGRNSFHMAQIRTEVYGPHTNKKLDPEKEEELLTKVFCYSCIADWKGVCDMLGNEIAYEKEESVKMMMELPDLKERLMMECSKVNNYREEVGNS